jgi:hypothetical protein
MRRHPGGAASQCVKVATQWLLRLILTQVNRETARVARFLFFPLKEVRLVTTRQYELASLQQSLRGRTRCPSFLGLRFRDGRCSTDRGRP